MSRGVVLRLDAACDAAVRALWTGLSAVGVPSLETHTHRQHAPHVSLTVAENLDREHTTQALAMVSRRDSLRVTLNAVGVFPEGVLFLTVVPTTALLDLQAEVHAIVTSLDTTIAPWPHSAPGCWTPHLTFGYGLTPQDAPAIALTLQGPPASSIRDEPLAGRRVKR